ncbi:hypothetical protein [uncultured Brachyspira sp.]|uniref:hypothetical protein n=1 Tax=uncultured Brachyspira sp. TaxID=221953 RepID=UPI00263144A7|nr:hypothetical protein [uncultured Brachyspira sp.]
MEDKKETEINRHVKAAVVGLDTATTSEDKAEREKFKNNLIKCYEQYPKFRPAVDNAYVATKRAFEKRGKTVEYGRLMEIGRILGIK